ncbi:DNA replication complex GINS protein SLD5 [Nakaseomyces bracarensis]|uniref:DNA replication complex GINS protein SLD5 n=1 Tax=Nakaseomyces bracarensis TaxID=273131 RepID=A0ABR4NV74_9SACH
MDIDIDDILAELDRDTTAVASSSGQHFPSSGPIDANSSLQHDATQTTMQNSYATDHQKHRDIIKPEEDYRRLVNHWRNERCAPELLPFPSLLMTRMLRRIQEQMEHIENISMGFLEQEVIDEEEEEDHNLSRKEMKNNALNNGKLPLLCMEAELERVKFVIRSFLRCRLHKIDKYSLYLRQIGNDGVGFVSLDTLMSKQELQYHERHSIILLKLFNNTILKHMPPELQAINDTEGSVSMIEEPNWKKFIFIYVNGPEDGNLGGDPLLELGEDGKHFYTVTIPEFDEVVELTIGSIYVMRYDIIKNLLEDNKVMLI